MPVFSPDCLQGRIAFVTGGSRGLGAEIVAQLAAHGATVTFSYLQDAGSAQQLVERVIAAGGVAKSYRCDVRSRETVRQTLADLTETFGGLDILVNNAGVNRRKFFEETTDEDWDLVLETNLKGAFICSQEALPYLKNSAAGRIINISSIASGMAGPKTLHYAVAKSGLDCMTRFLGRHCGPSGITVNSINPNVILTDQTLDEVLSPAGQAVVEETPLGRLGSLEDVGSAAVFLASDAAEYITGHLLHLNGGRYLG